MDWKRIERRLAKRLGGRRTGCTGRASEDISHPWLSVEVKARYQIPAWLQDAVAQATANASTDHLPVVILHEKGNPYRRCLVVLTLGDFEAWFGPLQHRSGGPGGTQNRTMAKPFGEDFEGGNGGTDG